MILHGSGEALQGKYFLRGLYTADHEIKLLIGCMGGGRRRIQVVASRVALLRVIVSLRVMASIRFLTLSPSNGTMERGISCKGSYDRPPDDEGAKDCVEM